MAKLDTPEHRAFLLAMQLHNPPAHPHWSEAVDWRPGRWDPLCNAPIGGRVLEVRGRDAAGRLLEPMHWACGDGDGLMPPFIGWFVPGGGGFVGVDPVEWQPLRAAPEAA
jgi:hypothetical protein